MQGGCAKWRKSFLSDLKRFEEVKSFKRVVWSTQRDSHVCPLCATRQGKYYTFEELRKEIEGTFCKPADPDDRCRCTIGVDENC